MSCNSIVRKGISVRLNEKLLEVECFEYLEMGVTANGRMGRLDGETK